MEIFIVYTVESLIIVRFTHRKNWHVARNSLITAKRVRGYSDGHFRVTTSNQGALSAIKSKDARFLWKSSWFIL